MTPHRAEDLDSGNVRQPRRFDRVAIRRLHAEGRSYRDIAGEVGCSLGVVQKAVAEGDGNDWVAALLQPVEPVFPVEDDLDVGTPSEIW